MEEKIKWKIIWNTKLSFIVCFFVMLSMTMLWTRRCQFPLRCSAEEKWQVAPGEWYWKRFSQGLLEILFQFPKFFEVSLNWKKKYSDCKNLDTVDIFLKKTEFGLTTFWWWPTEWFHLMMYPFYFFLITFFIIWSVRLQLLKMLWNSQ